MYDGHHYQPILDAFQGARVLCVGDVMLDRFVHGRVERISAEAPVPVLRIRSEQTMLGGAGNVARNVAALGANATLIAVTGEDRLALQIADLADAEPRLAPQLIVEAGRSSTVKTRFLADGQQLLRTDDEVVESISEETSRRVIAAIRNALPDTDVMVISDYAKGVLNDEVLRAAISEARAAGVPIIVDPKRVDFQAYSGVSVLKPNQAELAAATRIPCETDEQIEIAAGKVMSDCAIGAMLVTRSERGMSLVQRGSVSLHLAAKALEVFDVSGAGDTVLAATAVAMAAGADWPAAADLANVAGGIVVGKVGTAVVSRDELAATLLAMEVSSTETKIVSVGAAAAKARDWRGRGFRVGFTNGCFDLLHPGHVGLLTESKASCDRLIVAMNSDDSVKRLKGDDRPVQSETARAIVLASLATVDMVVVFSEDDPISLLEQIRPDILIKGGDYKIEDVVGADLVRSYGGEVKLATHVAGHSSTSVIDRMTGRDRAGDETPTRRALRSTRR